MSGWEKLICEFCGAYLGYRLGKHLSRRLKGQPFIAALVGLGIAFLGLELPSHHAFLSPGGRNTTFSVGLASALSLTLYLVGVEMIGDVLKPWWKAWRSRRAGQSDTGTVQPGESGDRDISVLSPRIRDLLEDGKVIHAIKAYREETGVGLREAKEAIDNARRILW